MEHTPGPWYNWERNADLGWITDTPEPSDNHVPPGTNVVAKVQNIGHWRTFDANARLIAAAPDLLAACKSAENWLSELEDGTDTGVQGLLAQLRAALATAEGG